MAVTGKSFANISPAEGAENFAVFDMAEASTQTYLIGAPLTVSTDGFAKECAANPISILGFAIIPGGLGASDGVKKAKFNKLVVGKRYQGTLSVTSLAQSHIGSKVALVKASSTWYFDTGTGASASAQFHVMRPAVGFGLGDSMPEVIVVADDGTKIIP